MDIAVNLPAKTSDTELSPSQKIEWIHQQEFATAIEDLEYDGIAIPDHLMLGDGRSMECLSMATALAQETKYVDIYPNTINTQLRHSPLLAKVCATIDNISDGRLKLGMGSGWNEKEARAFGYDWDSPPNRLREMEESIDIMKRLWTEDQVNFDGEFYDIKDAICKPHPIQDPHPPIMIGGGGEEFTLRIAAKHADTWNYYGSPSVLRNKLRVLSDHCQTYNRSFKDIQKSFFARCFVCETFTESETLHQYGLEKSSGDLIGAPQEILNQLEPYIEMGINEIVLDFIDYPNRKSIRMFAEEIMPRL